MKYTIISLDDQRLAYKKRIRENTRLEEIFIPAIDGRQVDILAEYKNRGLRPTDWAASKGESGIWMSNFDRWAAVAEMDEPLIVFEDDAIIPIDFDSKLRYIMSHLPPDWDYCALWVPDNQRIDYFYDSVFNEIGDAISIGPNRSNQESIYRVNDSNAIALVYQGYGMVSLMYSPAGGRKLVELSQKTGIYTPVDCWIYQQAHLGNLKGYAPHPFNAALVQYDWSAQTTVHNTERITF